MPKISVLIPVYKTNPEYLKEAIESILNQTFADFELLILDDCPDDDREEVVKYFQDGRIKYFKNEKNVGITPSRNRLIELATGEYLAVMDHDDVALPERFAEQVKILDTHPEIGVVGTLYQRFPKIKKPSKLPEKNDEIKKYLMEGCGVLHPSSMIRASVLKENGVRYESEFTPAEDYALWCRLIGKTQFYNIQKVLMKYRWHGANTSKLQEEKRLTAVEKIHSFLKKDHPVLFQEVHEKSVYIFRGKLFGFIPVFRFKKKEKSLPKWIRFLPFVRTKAKPEVK